MDLQGFKKTKINHKSSQNFLITVIKEFKIVFKKPEKSKSWTPLPETSFLDPPNQNPNRFLGTPLLTHRTISLLFPSNDLEKFFPPKFPFPKYKRKIWREKINLQKSEFYFAKERGPCLKRIFYISRNVPVGIEIGVSH